MSPETWYLIAAIAGASVLSMLYVMAAVIRDHERVEHLRNEVKRIQDDYARRLREMEEAAAIAGIAIDTAGAVSGDFDIVEDKKAA